MADTLTGGKLARILQDERGQGKSLNRIARDLYADFGIDVTGQTISNWCEELGIEKERAAS